PGVLPRPHRLVALPRHLRPVVGALRGGVPPPGAGRGRGDGARGVLPLRPRPPRAPGRPRAVAGVRGPPRVRAVAGAPCGVVVRRAGARRGRARVLLAALRRRRLVRAAGVGGGGRRRAPPRRQRPVALAAVAAAACEGARLAPLGATLAAWPGSRRLAKGRPGGIMAA